MNASFCSLGSPELLRTRPRTESLGFPGRGLPGGRGENSVASQPWQMRTTCWTGRTAAVPAPSPGFLHRPGQGPSEAAVATGAQSGAGAEAAGTHPEQAGYLACSFSLLFWKISESIFKIRMKYEMKIPFICSFSWQLFLTSDEVKQIIHKTVTGRGCPI